MSLYSVERLTPHRNTYTKDERLRSKKKIQRLFKEKKMVYQYPIVLYFSNSILETTEAKNNNTCLPQMLFSVSKSKFKHNTKRNLIKRRLRECWRTNKKNILTYISDHQSYIPTSMAFIYVSHHIEKYAIIKNSVSKATKTMSELLKNK